MDKNLKMIIKGCVFVEYVRSCWVFKDKPVVCVLVGLNGRSRHPPSNPRLSLKLKMERPTSDNEAPLLIQEQVYFFFYIRVWVENPPETQKYPKVHNSTCKQKPNFISRGKSELNQVKPSFLPSREDGPMINDQTTTITRPYTNTHKAHHIPDHLSIHDFHDFHNAMSWI